MELKSVSLNCLLYANDHIFMSATETTVKNLSIKRMCTVKNCLKINTEKTLSDN